MLYSHGLGISVIVRTGAVSTPSGPLNKVQNNFIARNIDIIMNTVRIERDVAM
jgi:hypothetical protein